MNHAQATLKHETPTASETPYAAYEDKPTRLSLSSSDSRRSRDDHVASQVQDNKHQAVAENVHRSEINAARVDSTYPACTIEINASDVPDGGLWAWLQVLGGFFLLFNTWYVHPFFLRKFCLGIQCTWNTMTFKCIKSILIASTLTHSLLMLQGHH